MTTTETAETAAASVPALQDALAAEHAAVHLLGYFGGVVSAGAEPDVHLLLRSRHQWHRDLRERLVGVLRAADESPTPAAAAYALPEQTDVDAVRSAAAEVEARCAQAYALLVASASGDVRALGLDALVETGRAMVAWGSEPQAFVGAPELAAGAQD